MTNEEAIEYNKNLRLYMQITDKESEYKFLEENYVALDMANKALEQRWIPVTERLPEEDSDILVTYVEKDEKRIVPVNYGCGTWFDCFFNKVLNQVGVLAWKPLPEPYGGEADG